MAESIVPGDVVTLKSGGPLMTVARVTSSVDPRDNNEAFCNWFSYEHAGAVSGNWFPLTSLAKSEDNVV